MSYEANPTMGDIVEIDYVETTGTFSAVYLATQKFPNHEALLLWKFSTGIEHMPYAAKGVMVVCCPRSNIEKMVVVETSHVWGPARYNKSSLTCDVSPPQMGTLVDVYLLDRATQWKHDLNHAMFLGTSSDAQFGSFWHFWCRDISGVIGPYRVPAALIDDIIIVSAIAATGAAT